jgi:hypothetical protein
MAGNFRAETHRREHSFLGDPGVLAAAFIATGELKREESRLAEAQRSQRRQKTRTKLVTLLVRRD